MAHGIQSKDKHTHSWYVEALDADAGAPGNTSQGAFSYSFSEYFLYYSRHIWYVEALDADAGAPGNSFRVALDPLQLAYMYVCMYVYIHVYM